MAKRKAAVLREFIFTGSVELRGVTFTVQAFDEDEAKENARAGIWHDYDAFGAETVNWKLDLRTIQPND